MKYMEKRITGVYLGTQGVQVLAVGENSEGFTICKVKALCDIKRGWEVWPEKGEVFTTLWRNVNEVA